MGVTKFFVLLLLASVATRARSHHHHGYYPEHRKGNGHVDFAEGTSAFERERTTVRSELLGKDERRSKEAASGKGSVPFSARRLEKMLEKAILKIITGDLSTADMLLLKSLNYSLEEVLAIRERELSRRKDEELRKLAELKSNGRRSYSEDPYGKRAKHWRHSSTMEYDSSSRNDADVEASRGERKKNRYKEKASHDKDLDLDLDAYNRQAVADYENLSNFERQQSWSDPADLDYEDESRRSSEEQSLHRSFDRAMEPHVVFKIRYDDSEFDSSSGSDERSKFAGRDVLVPKSPKHRVTPTLRQTHTTVRNVAANSFHASSLLSSLPPPPSASSSSPSSASSSATEHTPLPVVYQLGNFKGLLVKPADYSETRSSFNTTESSGTNVVANVTSNATLGTAEELDNSTNDGESRVKDADSAARKISEYEGLEWVEDDVYRVIPAFADSLGYDDVDENETSDYEEHGLPDTLPENGSENDTLEYQNDTPDPVKLFMANGNASVENASLVNLSYQQLALAHRRDGNVTSSFDSQGQKAIEDIKTRVLALTGRFNLSANANQVQRERLTMFSPTCQMPRNTDSEAWTDPFSMNMHFQLNLSSDDHVVAAKLRIYKLPQENPTTSVSGAFDEDEDDEKKIRISVYYYTKSLKKHRSKKRLMDSVVTPLTTDGTHLALDVRQGLRFWRPTPRNPHGNGSNHGLVIQIEDQDGRPLKPALYIQQPSCGEHDSDQKASQLVPALFVRACTRYVRIVNDQKVTYINCRH